MKTCTWNVIFMSMDVSYQDNANSRFFSKVIQLGASFFIKDVEAATYSDQLKITFFDFKSDDQKGSADVFKNISTNPDNKNALSKEYSITSFDCLDGKSYDAFFKKEFDNIGDSENEKIILILLAHSFGAGFFFKPDPVDATPVTIDDQIRSNQGSIIPTEGLDYFTTVQLHASIKNNLKPNKKLDCFVGLNCWLQSVETNIIFGDITNYLISSQQPLETTELSYQKLFLDLVYTSETPSGIKLPLKDEIIFSKFLYNCYQAYKKRLDKETRPIYKYDNFGLSLTKASCAHEFKHAMRRFWIEIFKNTKEDAKIKQLGDRNVDYWSYAAHFCADPSFIKSVNIIDANQFFFKLITFYPPGSAIEVAIQKMLSTLKNLVVLNVSSPFMCSTEVDEHNLMTTYIPFGIGIFVPKLLSANVLELLNIYATTHKSPKPTSATMVPKPPSNFFGNVLSYIAYIHKGNISYEDRNEIQQKLFNV